MRFLCLFGVVMVGCVRDEPAPRAEAPHRVEAPRDSRPVIVAFGDSLTEGLGVAEGQKYPDHLQRALDQAGYRYRVLNAGVSGDTSNNALERVQSVLRQSPKIVILEIGGNDGMRGLPVEGTRRNLEEMITALQSAGIKVALWGMTLPRSYGPDYIRSFEKMYAEVAKSHGLRMIPLRDELGKFAGNETLLQRDGIHPTGEGYRTLVPLILKSLEPELQR